MAVISSRKVAARILIIHRLNPSHWPPFTTADFVRLDLGVYIGGRNIDLGTCRGKAGEDIGDSYYWARLSGVTGTIDDILANDNANGPFYVEVETSGFALATDCELQLSQ